MSDNASAAVRYKAIVGLAAKAADDLRAWEHDRAEELTTEIAAAAQRVEEARERERTTTERVERWWKMASDNVSRLSWLDVGAPPEPNPTARGEYLNRHTEDIRAAYHELTSAILHLGWRSR